MLEVYLCVENHGISRFGELFRGVERSISRLAGNTREIDVVNYIRSETNLNLRCDPLPTRYDS